MGVRHRAVKEEEWKGAVRRLMSPSTPQPTTLGPPRSCPLHLSPTRHLSNSPPHKRAAPSYCPPPTAASSSTCRTSSETAKNSLDSAAYPGTCTFVHVPVKGAGTPNMTTLRPPRSASSSTWLSTASLLAPPSGCHGRAFCRPCAADRSTRFVPGLMLMVARVRRAPVARVLRVAARRRLESMG